MVHTNENTKSKTTCFFPATWKAKLRAIKTKCSDVQKMSWFVNLVLTSCFVVLFRTVRLSKIKCTQHAFRFI